METEYSIEILRVSSDRQGLQGDSPEQQKEVISNRRTQFAQSKGVTIINRKTFEFIESASGELDMQPIQKTIEYCKDPRNKIKYAFIKSIDRGTRGGATIYGQLKAMFARYGVQFVDVYGVIGTQVINTLAHHGMKYKWSEFSPTWITELLEAERAKSEVRDILTRMIGAEIHYVRLGYRVRPAPMGYKNVKVETPHGLRVILQPHEIEAPWFIRMYELRIQGNVTDTEIVEAINTMGFKSRRKRRRSSIDKTKVVGYMGEKPLTLKQFQRYIQNPIYAGVNNEKWTKEDPTTGRFAGLVTIGMFNAANRNKIAIIEESGKIMVVKDKLPEWRTTKNKDNPMFPHKNQVLCPICRNPLLGSAPRSKSGKHIPTYHCARKHKYWGVNKKVFDETIKNFVKNVKFEEGFASRFREIALEELEKREKQLSTDTVSYSEQIIANEAEIQNIKETIKKVSSIETIQMLEDDIEQLRLKNATLKANRDNKEDKQVDTQVTINYTNYFMEHLEDLLLGGSNLQKNASLFGLLFDEKPTYQELVDGTPKLACLFKLNDEYKTSQVLTVIRQGLEP